MQEQKKKRQIYARRRYEVEVGVRSIEENRANLKESRANIAICTFQHVMIEDELAERAKRVESCRQITRTPRKSSE